MDTLPIREIAFTEKSSKTKLQAGKEKFKQSKPDKSHSWGPQKSVKSLWSVSSNGNMVLYSVIQNFILLSACLFLFLPICQVYSIWYFLSWIIHWVGVAICRKNVIVYKYLFLSTKPMGVTMSIQHSLCLVAHF